MKSIIGTWSLKSFEVIKNGEVTEPFGNKVKGMVIYEKHGYMSGIVTGLNRPNVSTAATFGISEQERIEISKNFIAYAGKYSTKNDVVIHEIIVSFIPNLMNKKTHENTFKCDGNNMITISKPSNNNKDEISIILNWSRMESE